MYGYGGITIQEYDEENDVVNGSMNISKSDITLTQSTWDGSNNSLKDAIASLSARITALGG
jgi:hypothetical protein